MDLYTIDIFSDPVKVQNKNKNLYIGIITEWENRTPESSEKGHKRYYFDTDYSTLNKWTGLVTESELKAIYTGKRENTILKIYKTVNYSVDYTKGATI